MIASDINTTKRSLAILVWLGASYITLHIHVRFVYLNLKLNCQDKHSPLVFCLITKALKI